MMLSRDARELNCGRERVRGSRRVRCVGEESGEAWRGTSSRFSGVDRVRLVNTFGSTATCGEDGEESGIWSIFLGSYDGGMRQMPPRGGLLEGSALAAFDINGWRAETPSDTMSRSQSEPTAEHESRYIHDKEDPTRVGI